MSINILILTVSIVSTVEEGLEDISVETASVDFEVSFNTEEGKFLCLSTYFVSKEGFNLVLVQVKIFHLVNMLIHLMTSSSKNYFL